MNYPGWFACGSIMEYMESPYASRMALFSDRPDVLVEGEWIRCAPDAQPIPFLHAFGSAYWDFDNANFTRDLGEQLPRIKFIRGTPSPYAAGTGFCGTEAAWQFGTPFADRGQTVLDANGFPVCCPDRDLLGEFDQEYDDEFDVIHTEPE